MTRAQADRLAEGDRVKTKELSGTVVGTTKNCVSIQWEGGPCPKSSPRTTCGISARRTKQNDAKRCIKGALVGGGHHGALGASAGRVIGDNKAIKPNNPQPSTTGSAPQPE
jgi:hypothetical protein